MNKEDFFKLKIGQKIYFKNNGVKITKIVQSKFFDENYFRTFMYITFASDRGLSEYNWANICKDCSLISTKKNKKEN